MRRKDREVTDPEKIEAIIGSCHCCRLGFYDNGSVYIVPLSFGYEKHGEKRVFYFHSAMEGRKIDLIKTGQAVGFEMDANYELRQAVDACGYTAGFQSIIGTGKVSLVETIEEKIHGLKQIMFHNTGKTEWTFLPKVLEHVSVFKLEVSELSCKEHE